MLPLYEDLCFTFRFAEDRIIPRFHLEGVENGRRVEVFKFDPGTGERLGLLTTATAGDGGWVDLGEGPIRLEPDQRYLIVVHAVWDGRCVLFDTATGDLVPFVCAG